MIAIKIPENISSILQSIPISGDIVRADQSNHCTMFYMEKDPSIEDCLKIIPLVQKITEKTKPFIINLKSYTSFPEGKYGFPVVVKFNSPELNNLRKEIKNVFEENDIEFSNKFPKYISHITLQYNKKHIETNKFDELAFPIQSICLYVNKNDKEILFVEFPFGKLVKYSHDSLNDFSGLFEKLASNDVLLQKK